VTCPHLSWADQPGARAPGGVQHPHRPVPWPWIAQELVVVLVHRQDQHVALWAARGEGSNHVIGLGIADLNPTDAEQVKARLDRRQGTHRLQRFAANGPVGLVARIGLLALRGAVFRVEYHHDLGPTGQFLVDALAQQGEEHELSR
jgi:hypothetical protein